MTRTSMRNVAVALCVAAGVVPLARLGAQGAERAVNRDALVAQVATHVKVLAFTTDKPVREIRVLVNAKEVASDTFPGNNTGLKLAVVTPPHGKKEAEIFCDIGGGQGGYMKCAFRELNEANVLERESFGPGKDLALKGWTQVYGLTQHYLGRADALYDLRVEVR